MKTLKMASRYLIPLELFVAVILISWAIAGSLCDGNLHTALVHEGQNLWWGVVLGVTGAFQFIPAAIEWILGRRWDRQTLIVFLHMRSFASFLAMAAWLYVAYLVMAIQPTIYATLIVQCAAGFLCTMWSFIGNERARVVIDPRISTSNFERTIIGERQSAGEF